jgi:hypothetical protein
MTRLALALGLVQAWLAQGYRDGTTIERICTFPSWLLFRALFLAAFGMVSVRHRLRPSPAARG